MCVVIKDLINYMNKTKNAGVILIKRKLRVVHFNFGPIIMFWIMLCVMCVLLLLTNFVDFTYSYCIAKCYLL